MPPTAALFLTTIRHPTLHVILDVSLTPSKTYLRQHASGANPTLPDKSSEKHEIVAVVGCVGYCRITNPTLRIVVSTDLPVT
jgi:hypothetical protein